MLLNQEYINNVIRIIYEKYGLTLHESYTSNPNGMFQRTIAASIEANNIKLSHFSCIIVRTEHNVLALLYLWKGFVNGKAPIHLQLDNNSFDSNPVFIDPDSLSFVRMI